MSEVNSGSKESRALTPFQSRCGAEVVRVLREHSLSFHHEQIEGEEESYLVFSVDANNWEPLRVYVYEDEAGFFLGKDWNIWEAPDYDGMEELAHSFLEGLDTAIKGSSLVASNLGGAGSP